MLVVHLVQTGLRRLLVHTRAQMLEHCRVESSRLCVLGSGTHAIVRRDTHHVPIDDPVFSENGQQCLPTGKRHTLEGRVRRLAVALDDVHVDGGQHVQEFRAVLGDHQGIASRCSVRKSATHCATWLPPATVNAPPSQKSFCTSTIIKAVRAVALMSWPVPSRSCSGLRKTLQAT